MPASGPSPEATPAERFAWCLFDFANSAFNTVVVTFVYAGFFATVLVGDQDRGDVYWSTSLSIAGVVIAVASPVIGAVADRAARRKPYLIALSAITIACTALLFLPSVAPGAERASEAAVWAALLLFTAANVAFELTFVFYNSFLPGLGGERTIGRLSGYGWALGYAGGLLSLAVCLGCVGVGGIGPWLPAAGHVNVRATTLVAAAWFALFALPMFLLVRDRGAPVLAPGAPAVRGALAQVWRTLGTLPSYPDLLRLLVARLFYNDAVMAVIVLSGLYMKGTLQMDVQSILLVGIWLNVAAGLGALVFGFVDDFFGAKTAILASLGLLLSGSLTAVFAPTVAVFVVAATLVGLGLGPNQAASRTMLARFVPAERAAEFYGLFALSGKATVWLGPLLFTLVRAATAGHPHSQRLAFAPLVLLFAAGTVLLLGVDEKRGRERALTARAGRA